MDLDPRFLNGMIVKTAILGLILTLVSLFSGFFSNFHLAISIFIGATLAAVNLWIFTVAMAILMEGKRSQLTWSFLLFGKMITLIALIWFLIGIVNINALGFAFGFSLFLPAMFWQMIAGPKR